MLALGREYRLYQLTRDISLVTEGAETTLHDPLPCQRMHLVITDTGMEGEGVTGTVSRGGPLTASKCSKMLWIAIALLEVTLLQMSSVFLNQKTMHGWGMPYAARSVPSHSMENCLEGFAHTHMHL